MHKSLIINESILHISLDFLSDSCIMVYMIKTKRENMITVETTLENEYLDTLEKLCVEKVDRVKKIESLENRIAHELYMIKTLEERMSTMSENYHKDIVNTVEAALCS